MSQGTTIKIAIDGSLAIDTNGAIPRLAITTSRLVEGQWENEADQQHALIAANSFLGGHRTEPLLAVDARLFVNNPVKGVGKTLLERRLRTALRLIGLSATFSSSVAGDGVSINISTLYRQ